MASDPSVCPLKQTVCTARSAASDRIRERLVNPSCGDAVDQLPDSFAMRAPLRAMIDAPIDRLPETFHAVFVLCAVQEASVKEVAEALDIPEATVRTRFFRARGLMHENMASEIDLAMADAFAFDRERCDRIVAAALTRARQEGLWPAFT